MQGYSRVIAHLGLARKVMAVVDGSAEEIRLAKTGGSLAVLAAAGGFPQERMTDWKIEVAVDPAEVSGATEGFAPWHRGVSGEQAHPVK